MGVGPSAPRDEQAERLLGSLDAACGEAARLISEADVLLLCTGAGFSADSGLAIYADVAKVKAYADRGLQYHDICHPRWLRSNPELFWGFWGQCYNDYRDTAPHAGYEIINRWAEDRFRYSPTGKSVRRRLEVQKAAAAAKGDERGPRQGMDALLGEEPPSAAKQGPYEVKDFAGAFFVFTSNVDAHHFDWFRACEIRECHGNTELYQCAECNDHPQPVWRIPLDFRFQVDKDTMLAPVAAAASSPPAAAEPPVEGAAPAEAAAEEPAAEAAEEAAKTEEQAAGAGEAKQGASAGAEAPEGSGGEDASKEATPRVGRVFGDKRTMTLRHMPEPPNGTSREGFGSNHPKCPFCGGEARPAILMFGDVEWQDVSAQQRQWSEWCKAVRSHVVDVEERRADRVRAVVLEIGAGGNVTTVRNNSESQLRSLLECGAVAHLVRVNPEYPLGDEEDFGPDGTRGERVVSVMSRGLDAIIRIDLAMAALRSKASTPSPAWTAPCLPSGARRRRSAPSSSMRARRRLGAEAAAAPAQPEQGPAKRRRQNQKG